MPSSPPLVVMNQPPIFQKRKLILEGQGFSWDTVVPEVCMSGPQRGFTHSFHLHGQAPSSGGKGGVGDGVARNSAGSSHGEKEGNGWLGPFWACPSLSCLPPDLTPAAWLSGGRGI